MAAKQFVEVTLVGGSNLAPKDSDGLSDPYCKITASGYHGKTKVCNNTLTPSWDLHWCELIKPDSPFKAHIEVHDHNTIMKDQYMGECDLTLPADLKLMEERVIEVPLAAGPKYKEKKVSGKLTFKLKLTDQNIQFAESVVDGITKDITAALKDVDFSKIEKHPSLGTGQATGSSHGCNYVRSITCKTEKEFNLPSVAEDSQKRVIIGHSTIDIYSQEGEFVKTIGDKSKMYSVAVDKDDNIWTMSSSKPLRKYDKEGNLLLTVKASFDIYARLGISGDKIFTRSFAGTQVFDLEGKLVFKKPSDRGETVVGKCKDGFYVSAGPEKFAVACQDTDHHKVLLYNHDGTFVSEFGKMGEFRKPINGDFYYPDGLAFDAKGRIYVKDGSGYTRVQVFSPEGQYLHTCCEDDTFTTGFGVGAYTGQLYVAGEAVKVYEPFN